MKYNLLQGISAAYNYVLKHTSLEPSDDLYQDVAVDYIERYNEGKTHQRIITTLREKYERKCMRDLKPEFIPVSRPNVLNEDDMMRHIMMDDLFIVLDTLTEKEISVLLWYYFENMTFAEISKKLGYKSVSYTPIISYKAIRKLRHPSRAKRIKDLYFLCMDAIDQR